MFGWFSEASTLASRSKRASLSGSCARAAGRILIATSRSSLVSRARYTSPIPPAPIGARISYGPSLAPTDSGICVIQLSLANQEAYRECITRYTDIGLGTEGSGSGDLIRERD